MSGATAIFEKATNPQRRPTTNYYPILSRAVAALRPDCEEARVEIYERARDTLADQLKMVEPPLSGADVAAEMWALEAAIARISPAPATSKLTKTDAVTQSVASDLNGTANGPRSEGPPAPGYLAEGMGTVQNGVAREPSTHRGPSARIAMLARIAIVLVAVLLAAAVGYSTVGSLDVVYSENRGWILLALQQTTIAFFVIALPPLYLVSFLRRRSRLLAAGLIKHLIPSFARNDTRPNALQQTAQRLGDHGLLWSYFLPDHKPQAKAVAAAELERRGYLREDFENWSPGGEELTVPPAIDGEIAVSRYGALKRRKALWFKLFQWSAFVIAAIIATGIVIAILEELPIPFNDNLPDLNRWLDEPGIPKVVFYTIMVFWLSSPLLAGFLFRKRALRILLLRPFGEKRMTRALRRFVPKHLGPQGYVFTLSDRNYKPSLLIGALLMVPIQCFDILVTYLLGPLLRHSIRICSVRNERKFRRLQAILMRKFRPSAWSFLSGAQAFNIRTTDEWWQSCIALLAHSCDVIVIDLSKVKAGTKWELDELRLRGLHHKCLFIGGEEDLANAGALLDTHFANEVPPFVHLYANTGRLLDPRSFAEHIKSLAEPAIADCNHAQR